MGETDPASLDMANSVSRASSVSPVDRVDAAALGWDENSRGPLRPDEGFGISRVAVGHRGAYKLIGPLGTFMASVDPSLRRQAAASADLPAVGDWVVHELEPRHNFRVVLTEMLERRSVVVRKAAGNRPMPQVVAANVDVLGVVTTAEMLASGADSETGYRLERYLVAAAQGGVRTVIVVNKADIAQPDIAAARRRFEVEVLTTSAATGLGSDKLVAFATRGSTLALAGASGVGKSSLVNRLLGSEVLEVGQVSGDGRGRHTTIRRELFVAESVHPHAGTVIDTPGLSDMVPWTDGSTAGVDAVFADIAELARQCHFTDCAHRSEPKCAVRAAADSGELDGRRLSVYLALAVSGP